MKNLFVIIALISVALCTSCSKEKEFAHNRYMTYGDYTFEVISGPDEYGDIKIKIRNTKDSSFFYLQEYNDVDAIKRLCYIELSISDMMDASQRTIIINKTSSLIIYPKQEMKVVPKKGEVKIFESASNFFNIY